MNDLPIAYGRVYKPFEPIKVNKKPYWPSSSWQIVVKCPFCGREHIHGWGPDNLPDDPKQTRKSHCDKGDIYRLVVEGAKCQP